MVPNALWLFCFASLPKISPFHPPSRKAVLLETGFSVDSYFLSWKYESSVSRDLLVPLRNQPSVSLSFLFFRRLLSCLFIFVFRVPTTIWQVGVCFCFS